MFVKDNKRFNLNAFLDGVYVDADGIQHPGRLLRDPDFRAVQGITEIADPERGNDETQYTQELDVAPWIVITDKSPEQIEQALVAKLTTAVQNHLDEAAKDKGYDGILSAASYAAVANPFQAEAISFLEWRSAVWAKAYEVLADVKAANRTAPTVEELIAELPARVVPV